MFSATTKISSWGLEIHSNKKRNWQLESYIWCLPVKSKKEIVLKFDFSLKMHEIVNKKLNYLINVRIDRLKLLINITEILSNINILCCKYSFWYEITLFNIGRVDWKRKEIEIIIAEESIKYNKNFGIGSKIIENYYKNVKNNSKYNWLN